jgi:S1-C subfamily serine protease
MKHEHHRNVLYVIVVLLVILQTVSFVVLSSQLSKMHVDLENNRVESVQAREGIISQFTELINFYSGENQKEIDKLSLTLAEQEESFAKELDLVKSSRDDFSGIIKNSLDSVVGIRTDRSIGTGFVVNSEGYIVTNYHVIDGATSLGVVTSKGDIIGAQILGIDPFRDVALLKVDRKFDALKVANSDNLQVGKKVIAIGNPLGLSFSVSEGIISALGRAGPNGLEEYIQTDVGLNPGNSGGPLIDETGKVIGINNFKIGDSEGLGFALESNSFKKVVNGFINGTII